MPADLTWRTSGWDHHMHAFQPDLIGEIVAEAVCTHSAQSTKLRDPAEGDRPCLACLLIVGDRMADTHEEQGTSPEWGGQ